jgi:hypothetical protein
MLWIALKVKNCNIRESLIADGLLDGEAPTPRFRIISNGLYYCEDGDFIKQLPKPTGEFISYHQLRPDLLAYKQQ